MIDILIIIGIIVLVTLIIKIQSNRFITGWILGGINWVSITNRMDQNKLQNDTPISYHFKTIGNKDPILLEKGLSRLIPIIEGIDANQFEANPDKQTCQYCDFSGICPDRY